MLLTHRFQSNITLCIWLALLLNRGMLYVLRPLHKLKIPKLETEQSTFCGHMLKFSDSKYFHFHYNMQCSEAGHLFKCLKTYTNLPFIKTKRRHVHRYLRIVTSFLRAAHLEWKCVYATIFLTVCRETKKTRRKCFGISEAELPRFVCVNIFSLQGQSRAQFRLIYVIVFRYIKFRIVKP